MRTIDTYSALRVTLVGALSALGLHCGGNVVVDDTASAGIGGGGSSGSGEGASSVTVTVSNGTTIPASSVTSVTSTSTGTTAGCLDGKPITNPDGSATGFVRCPDGAVDRAFVGSCDTTVPGEACQFTEQNIACKADADCTAAPNGRCRHYDASFEGTDGCGCVYPCANDGECGGGVCVCANAFDTGPGVATCAAIAGCLTDADCPSGECGASIYDDGCGQVLSTTCRGPGDECRSDAGCVGSPGGNQCVAYATSLDAGFTCATQNCAIGRPMLVEGEARRAAPTGRDDWRASTELVSARDLAALSPDARARLAAHWSSIAALEHASVGSFARFTLELLSLGAPPDLLADAQRAALDEVEHAKVAYALASAFAGAATGPGPLDLAGAAPRAGLRDVALALVHEACVGETVGAAEARELAGAVRDPALRTRLEAIADDEARHAELAWRALAWCVKRGGAELAADVARAFDEACEAIVNGSGDDADASGAELAAYGVGRARDVRAIRERAVREIVRPCALAFG